MDSMQLLLAFSAFLSVSALPHFSQYLGILHLLAQLSFFTKSLIFSMIFITTLYSFCWFLKFKTSLFSLRVIALLCLPWAFHLVSDQIPAENQDKKKEIIFAFLPLGLTIPCVALYYFKIRPFYQSYQLNKTLTLQSITNILDIARLVVCKVVSFYIQGPFLISIIFLMNIAATSSKILHVTYLDPKMQYTFLMMETWSWFSLILAIFPSEEIQAQIFFESFVLILVFCIFRPTSKTVNIFQMKIEQNLRRFKKNNPIFYDILLAQYITKIFKQRVEFRDPFIQCLSPQFIFFIKSQFESYLDLREFTDHSSQTSLISSQRWLKNLKINQQNIVKNICRFFQKRQTLAKCLDFQQDQIAILVYNLLCKNNLVQIKHIFELYAQIFGQKNKLSLPQRISLENCYQKLIKCIKSLSRSTSYNRNDELIGLEKLEDLVDKFIQNQMNKFKKTTQDISNCQMKEYLNSRSRIRKQIHSEIDFVKEKGISTLKLALLQFIVKKFIDSSPNIALQFLKCSVTQLSSSNCCIAQNEAAIFVCTLPHQEIYIKHCNDKFKDILEYTQQYSLQLHQIIPECYRYLHKAIFQKNYPLEEISLYEHSSMTFFRSLRSQSIHRGALTQKIYIGFEELLILGCCNIQEEESIQMRLKSSEKKQGEEINILGRKFMISSSFNKTEKSVHINPNIPQFQKKETQTTNHSYLSAEKQRASIHPLQKDLILYGGTVAVAMLVVFIGIGIIEYNLMDIIDLNSRMNNIQNEFYRFMAITQIYFPTLLVNYHISSLSSSLQELNIQRQYILKEVEYIEEELSDFLYTTIGIFESDKVILEDMFEVIPETAHIRFQKDQTYFYQLIYDLHLELKSVISMLKGNYDPNKSQKFILFGLKLTHILQQKNIFAIAARQLASENKVSLIYRYIGYYLVNCVFNGFIVLYLLMNINTSYKIQHFLKKSQLSAKLSSSARGILLQFSKSFSSLRKSEFNENNGFFKKSASIRQAHAQYLNKDNFYNYKLIIFLGFVFILCEYGAVTLYLNKEAYPKITLDADEIYSSKLMLTLLIANEVHNIQQIAIEILNSQGIWTDLYLEDKYGKQTDETQILQLTNTMEILENFTMGHKFLKISENPCQSLIDCSKLEEEFGEKTDGLIVIKNRVYILLREIESLRSSNSSFDLTFSHTSQVRSILSYSRKMIYIANELFKLDSMLSAVEINSSYMTCMQIIVMMGLLFVYIMWEYSRMRRIYFRYKDQIYRLVPLEELATDPDFSREVNRLVQSV